MNTPNQMREIDPADSATGVTPGSLETVHYVGPDAWDIDLAFGDLAQVVERNHGTGLSSTVVISWTGAETGLRLTSLPMPTYWISTPEQFRKYGC